MKTLITAFTAASLLLGAVPALADRDDRHHNSDQRRQFAQQQREQHTKMRDMENRRAEIRQERREDRREERREDRREERREERRDDRRDHRNDKDDHKFVKYVGYDPRYDKNRHNGHGHHDRGHGHGHHRPVHLPHKHRFRPAHYGYGYRWTRLPARYVSLTFGGLGYYFSEGIFYRPHGPGYVVAQAPIGAFVQVLPGTAVNVSYNGLGYFVAYDTYYRWDNHRRGYLVVANPGFI